MSIIFALTIMVALASDDVEAIPDGTIYGHVFDADTKQPLSQAWVYCQDVDCQKKTSNIDGYYGLEGCFSPSKTYTLQCTKHGYETSSKTIETDTKGNARLDFFIPNERPKDEINKKPENLAVSNLNATKRSKYTEIRIRGEVLEISQDRSELTLRVTSPIEAVGTKSIQKQSGSGLGLLFISKSSGRNIGIGTDSICQITYMLDKSIGEIIPGDIVEVLGYYIDDNNSQATDVHHINVCDENQYIDKNESLEEYVGAGGWGVLNASSWWIEADFADSQKYLNRPPKLIAIVPSKKSPQKGGTEISWQASAIDPDNDLIYYEFWLKGPRTGGKWEIVQSWSMSNTWTWFSAQADIGASDVRVWTADGKHAYMSERDDSKEYKGYQIIG